MKKKLILASARNFVTKVFNVEDIRSYLLFNNIEHEFIDLDTEDKNNFVNQLHTWGQDNILIIDYDIFPNLMQNSWENTLDKLSSFCKKNRICIWNDADGLLAIISAEYKFRQLGQLIPKHSLSIVIDGEMTSSIKSFDNIQLMTMPLNWFFQMPRIQGADIDKISPNHDYLLTMIRKPSAPHRDVLWKEINSRSGLIDRGYVSYQDTKRQQWIGKKPPSTMHWIDGVPSMDLYRDSWIEIVPETFYKDGLFITEKLIKPIATMTPFLTLSTPGYLEYVKTFGFRTFNSLIDESYDQETDLNQRTKLLVDQVENIITNGADNFYSACLDILKHNQQNLFELVGKRQMISDRFVAKILQELGATNLT